LQHHQATDKQDNWHFEEMQNGGGCELVYSKIVILQNSDFATLSTLWCPFASPF